MNLQMLEDCIGTYEKCILTVEKWVNISLKYELTRDQRLLKAILSELPEVYVKEYESLEGIVNHCIDLQRFNEIYV